MPSWAALLLGLLLAAVQQQPDERVVRSATVEGWLVEDVSEMDGGLMVRIQRRTTGVELEWFTSYWRGNGGPIRGAALSYGECASGDAGTLHDPALQISDETLRAQFSDYLTDCEVPAAQAATTLQGLDAAYRLGRLGGGGRGCGGG